MIAIHTRELKSSPPTEQNVYFWEASDLSKEAQGWLGSAECVGIISNTVTATRYVLLLAVFCEILDRPAFAPQWSPAGSARIGRPEGC